MKKIIFLLAALTAMVACSKETNSDAPESCAFVKGQEVTISSCATMTGQTKVVGTDNTTAIDFTWEEGDQIKVKVGEATATFTLA